MLNIDNLPSDVSSYGNRPNNVAHNSPKLEMSRFCFVLDWAPEAPGVTAFFSKRDQFRIPKMVRSEKMGTMSALFRVVHGPIPTQAVPLVGVRRLSSFTPVTSTR